MSDLKDIHQILKELTDTNDHLHNLVSRIKDFDKNWFESSCDTNIVFGLLGHKEHVDHKLHELSLKIKELENNK